MAGLTIYIDDKDLKKAQDGSVVDLVKRGTWQQYRNGTLDRPNLGPVINDIYDKEVSKLNPNWTTMVNPSKTDRNWKRDRFIIDNKDNFETLVNLSEFPVEFGNMLYDEGFIDNSINAGNRKIEIDGRYKARNGNDNIPGDFGLDSLEGTEIERSRLTEQEKDDLKSRLTMGHPNNGDSYIGVDYITPRQAVAVFDVKMNDNLQRLYNQFGKENVENFFRNNKGSRYGMMRVMYRMPYKFNNVRNIIGKDATIEKYYDFLNNYGGKNKSLIQAEEFVKKIDGKNMYQQGGPTHLQPWDEQRFRMWFNSLPEGIRNSNDYDYRGWWKENGSIPYKNGVHFTDKFKLPNHPTFSEESIYSKGNTEGGYWTKDGFVPSQYNTRNGSDRIIDYMEFAEPKGTKMYDTNGMVATFHNGGPKRKLKDNFNKFTKQELDFISNNWNTGQTFTDGEFVYVMPGDTASNLHNRNVKQTLFDNGLPRSNASMVSTSNGWKISHAMDERYAGNEGRSWDNYIVKYYVGDNKDLIPQNAQYITVDENGNYVLNNGVPRLNDGGETGLSIFIDDEQFKKGGQIHIKEKNKGKFTKQAQSAGMSVQEFARHVLAHKDRYPASTVKRANFARNATKFNH